MKARRRRGLFRAQTTLMHFVLGSHPLRPLRSSKNQPCPVRARFRAQNRRRGATGKCRNDPSTPRHRSCRCAPRYASCGSWRKRRLGASVGVAHVGHSRFLPKEASRHLRPLRAMDDHPSDSLVIGMQVLPRQNMALPAAVPYHPESRHRPRKVGQCCDDNAAQRSISTG